MNLAIALKLVPRHLLPTAEEPKTRVRLISEAQAAKLSAMRKSHYSWPECKAWLESQDVHVGDSRMKNAVHEYDNGPKIHTTRRGPNERRGKHGNQPKKEDHYKAVMTKELAAFLRQKRVEENLTVKELHYRYAPKLNYWTVKDIFTATSVW